MSNFNVDFCCTCLKICTGNDKLVSLGLEASREITYRKKLKSCVPEMILQNTEDCFLCMSCSEALENAYNFRSMCLITQNKLQEYRALQQRNLKDICSIREDLLQVLSRELKDLERENPVITAAKELGNLLNETLGKQESNSALSYKKLSKKRRLSDDDLIKKACKIIPELKNVPEAAFKCQVSLEKIVVKNLPIVIPNNDDKKRNSKYYCGMCDKVIKKKERFYSHMLRHSNIKGYKCDDCTAAYFSADSLRHHRKKTHLTPSNVNNDTSRTNKTLAKSKNVTIKVPEKKKIDVKKKKTIHEQKCILKIKLPRKIKKTSRLKDKVFHCNYCDYNTTLKHLYDGHTLLHSGGGNYQCALCPKVYFAQWELNRHIRANHKISENVTSKKKNKSKVPPPIQVKEEVDYGDEEVVCTICTERFSSQSEYKRHLKTHTKPNSKLSKKKKKFFCSICNFEFSSRDHANIHTGAKPYTCNMCSKTFAAYTTLRKHRNTHANASEKITVTQLLKKHMCEICKQEFEKAAELCSHNCQTSSGESVYRCQICRNAYLGRTALIDHMRLHVGQNGD